MNRTSRKIEHIENTLAITEQQFHSFEDITFVHNSLPNTNVEDIDLSTKIGELEVSSPIFINAMTGGGGQRTVNINRLLAETAKDFSLSIAVGSQMAALKDKQERATFEIVRKTYPNGVVIGNLGSEASVDQAKAAVDMIEANALQIHLNVVQELVMPEGDRTFKGALQRIEAIVSNVNVPVIVKEVGFGISKETATKLANIGVSIIDVGGHGGTNFSKIENKRREEGIDFFNDWGIPTAASICEVKSAQPFLSVIGSGGIKNGLDIAKALSLGTSGVGIAGLLLRALHNDGAKGLELTILRLHEELRLVMTALGANTITGLKKVPLVISGKTYHWLEQRGICTKNYSLRK